jgi:hypothetical protein
MSGGANVIAVSDILSVRVERRSFSTSRNVYIRDLVNRYHVLQFSNLDVAHEFFAAIRQVKGSLTVEQDQVSIGFWF